MANTNYSQITQNLIQKTVQSTLVIVNACTSC